MDDVKIGEILMPGDEETQARQETRVRSKFWSTLKRAMRHLPFGRDVVAAYYCAMDPATPTRVRGILLAALGYFILPLDAIPDALAFIGFSDDLAVLTTAISLVSRYMTEGHYAAADEALKDDA